MRLAGVDWLGGAPPYQLLSASNTPGIFSLLRVLPGLWPILAVVAVIIFAWGQLQSKEVARAGALLSSPIGLFSATMALLGCAPAWLLVPFSLAAAALSLGTGTFIPFLALPPAVPGWQLRQAEHRAVLDQPERAEVRQ